MSEAVVRSSGVPSGMSPKPRARRGCMCFLEFIVECKSGEGLSPEGAHPEM
jgi:hypothetical protein